MIGSAETQKPAGGSFQAVSKKTSPAQLVSLGILLLMFLFSFALPGVPASDWTFPADKLLHAVSGAALALIFSRYFKSRGRLFAFIFALGALFEAAEFFAVPFGAYGDVDRYIIDTILDLMIDVLGAIIAIQFARQKYA